VILSTNKGVR